MAEHTNARAGALLDQGIARFERNDHEGALRLFERATAADPSLHGAWYLRGVCCNALGRFADAVTAFEGAVAAAPDDGDSHFNLGNAHLHLGDFERAIPSLEHGYALGVTDLDDAGALFNLALAHFELGKRGGDRRYLVRALELFEAVERANPLHAAAIFERAMVLTLLARHDEAVRELARVIAFDPASTHPTVVQAHVAEAVAFTALGRFEEALSSLRTAVQKEPRVAGVAARDPDFDALRASPMGPGFVSLVGAPSPLPLALPCDVALTMAPADLASLRAWITARATSVVPAMQELLDASTQQPALLTFALRERAVVGALVDAVRDWAVTERPQLVDSLNWEYDRRHLAFSDLATRAPRSLADLAALAESEPAAKKKPAVKKKPVAVKK